MDWLQSVTVITGSVSTRTGSTNRNACVRQHSDSNGNHNDFFNDRNVDLVSSLTRTVMPQLDSVIQRILSQWSNQPLARLYYQGSKNHMKVILSVHVSQRYESVKRITALIN
jgi:hypothetical protein